MRRRIDFPWAGFVAALIALSAHYYRGISFGWTLVLTIALSVLLTFVFAIGSAAIKDFRRMRAQ